MHAIIFERSGMQHDHQNSLLALSLRFLQKILEREKRIHQDIRFMEKQYQERWDVHMMADNC